MKVASLTKIALAGGLLLGQTQPVERFYEDDEDFNLASAVLMEGWNWGINKASAADECTNNESTSAEQCLEVIEIEGQYDPTGELSLEQQLDPSQYENIEPPPPSGGPIEYELEEYTEVIDCKSQAQQDYEVCKNNSTDTANSSFYTCYKRYWDNTNLYNSCRQSVSNIFEIDMKRCETIKQDELNKCT